MTTSRPPLRPLARTMLLALVLLATVRGLGRPGGEGSRWVVASRLIPSRPSEWRRIGEAQPETFLRRGNGWPAVAVALPGAPLRWALEVPEAARLDLGFALRRSGVPEVGEEELWRERRRRRLARRGRGPRDVAPAPGPTPSVSGDVALSIRWRPRGSSASRELLRLERPVARLLAGVERLRLRLPAGRGEIELAAASIAPEAGELEAVWLDPVVSALRPRPGPNLLIVCVDTLRADRLAILGGAESRMPRLERRLASAAVFRRAYANAPWTLPSISTALTGLTPGLHNAGRRTTLGPSPVRTNYSAQPTEGGIELTVRGVRYRFQMLHPSVPTLHRILGAEGFRTGAIFRNGYLNYPTRVFVGADSFRHYRGRAPEGAKLAIDWLSRHRDERFFFFLHFIDPHQWARELPRPMRKLRPRELGAADREKILGVYDGLVRETDAQIDRVLRALERMRLADDTIVVFFADHGERFFEKGVRGSHGGSQYESVLRVPLAFWGPGVPRARVDARVALVDLAPTVLDLLGVRTAETFSGRSLVPWMQRGAGGDQTVVSEFTLWSEPQAALLEDGWKYIWRDGKPDELYYLPDDPHEERNLARERPGVAAAMRRSLERHRAAGDRRFARTRYGETRLDAATESSLRALGYVE